MCSHLYVDLQVQVTITLYRVRHLLDSLTCTIRQTHRFDEHERHQVVALAKTTIVKAAFYLKEIDLDVLNCSITMITERNVASCGYEEVVASEERIYQKEKQGGSLCR